MNNAFEWRTMCHSHQDRYAKTYLMYNEVNYLKCWRAWDIVSGMIVQLLNHFNNLNLLPLLKNPQCHPLNVFENRTTMTIIIIWARARADHSWYQKSEHDWLRHKVSIAICSKVSTILFIFSIASSYRGASVTETKASKATHSTIYQFVASIHIIMAS